METILTILGGVILGIVMTVAVLAARRDNGKSFKEEATELFNDRMKR